MARLNRRNGLLIIPFMVVFCIFSLYPVIRTFMMGFYNIRRNKETFIGIDNYERVFKDKLFGEALTNTIVIWGLNIIIQLAIAMLLTMVFSDQKYKVKGLSVWRAIYYLPGIIASTSVAALFRSLCDWQYGSINRLMVDAGIISSSINFLGESRPAQLLVSLIQAWMWFGNSFLLLMAAVQGVSRDYYEAAAIDGAGRWTTYFKITFPLIRPVFLYVIVTSIIGGMQLFDMPFLFGSYFGNPNGSLRTMVLYQFAMAFKHNQMGYASAMAVVLCLMIAVLSVIAYFLMYGGRNKEGN